MQKVLVTGGCGFIGKALSLRLIRCGYKVRILDCLTSQVHGENPDLQWIKENQILLLQGSVNNKDDCDTALEQIDTVVHLAAETGTGQSMYEIEKYMHTNVVGTATLLEACKKHNVKNFVLASSRAVYGEGMWQCDECGRVHPEARTYATRKPENWNPRCPRCSAYTSTIIPTNEDDPLTPTSVYGISKQCQEQLVALIGQSTGMTYNILRCFNVFGPGQSLQNPYTGVMTVFVNRARQNKTLDLYEDGNILRDFVYIDDLVAAIHRTIESEYSGIYNVGTGVSISIRYLAEMIIKWSGSTSSMHITRKTRYGDVRGLIADVTKAKRLLQWEPKISSEQGIQRFVTWAVSLEFEDRYEQSLEELEQHNVYR
jgi:dTDP-L-rhamnose 4-epimerase